MKHWLIELLIYVLTLAFIALSCVGLTRIYNGYLEDVWEEMRE